ncbi:MULTISPECIES: ester cyclase [Streptomyces]|uniref:ester cyclase n=1 Tax=Streptomyces TaxID=1883 RepID=UPI0033FE5910
MRPRPTPDRRRIAVGLVPRQLRPHSSCRAPSILLDVPRHQNPRAASCSARDPEKADDFVAEDFVITTGGERVEGRDNFKNWIRGFLGQVDDLRLEVIETLQNQDGSRVASRWRVHGRNNGVLGTEADGRPISFTGPRSGRSARTASSCTAGRTGELGAVPAPHGAARHDALTRSGRRVTHPPARTVGAPLSGAARMRLSSARAWLSPEKAGSPRSVTDTGGKRRRHVPVAGPGRQGRARSWPVHAPPFRPAARHRFQESALRASSRRCPPGPGPPPHRPHVLHREHREGDVGGCAVTGAPPAGKRGRLSPLWGRGGG